MCLSVCPTASVCLSRFQHLSVHLFVCLPLRLFLYLSIRQPCRLSVSLSASLYVCLSIFLLVSPSLLLSVRLYICLSHSLFCHLLRWLILFYFAFHFQAENYGNFLVRFGPADKAAAPAAAAAACARLDAPDPPAAAAAAHRKSKRDRRRRCDKPLGHKCSPTRGQLLSNCDSLESWLAQRPTAR